MKAFPNSAIIDVPSDLAEELWQSSAPLPWRENKEYYNVSLQTGVYEYMRNNCGDRFNNLVAQMKQCLMSPPFSALVRGLKFDKGHRLFVSLNRAFGVLVAPPYDGHSPRSQLIHHIHPSTDLAITSDLRKQTERLHTDCADWSEPNNYVAMQCVRPDALGEGRSRQIDMYELQAALNEYADSNLVHYLYQEPVPWQLADYLGGGVVWHPIFTTKTLRWRRYTIDFALGNKGIKLSKSMITALDILEKVLTKTDRIIDFALEAGDFLILDNKRCLHARTPIVNPNTQRLMLRA